jgi:hypothetical protein
VRASGTVGTRVGDGYSRFGMWCTASWVAGTCFRTLDITGGASGVGVFAGHISGKIYKK